MTALGQRWFVLQGRSHNLPLPRLLLLGKHLLSWRPHLSWSRTPLDPPPSTPLELRWDPKTNHSETQGGCATCTWPTEAPHVGGNTSSSKQLRITLRCWLSVLHQIVFSYTASEICFSYFITYMRDSQQGNHQHLCLGGKTDWGDTGLSQIYCHINH